ncbi:hypothetical protein DYB30_000508 [Aphanomyces astaci]|uniref:PH domain-containing protein n=1 Tax=Aphanomyces astaci TaxID=112090 RepID=A0A397D6M1_APHAT|nr:hypothetical protein DYB36_003582 [Aphanomyces astaci]RHY59748.1 hypothetical protein DYB38_000462 [Aphanomyces astaci]RHY64478.1 hypothetical protein DYB30_000508 [Aphanomyces astaci]RHY67644.1 hypothetical protein DYB34_002455 [Aphanomyces astaci]RHY99861.1 hypothetical protein DYB31_005715 [Aphanomyces astaci]
MARRGSTPSRMFTNSIDEIVPESSNGATTTLALASSIAMSSWLRYKGGFFKGWTMYYFVLSRTNQLTAYATDEYEGKAWKFRVQAMMVQPNRSVHLGFVVTTLKDGVIALAATNGHEYKQWIEVLCEKQPLLHPTLTRQALEAQNARDAVSERGSHSTDIYLYVPTAVIPLQSGLVDQAKDEIFTLQKHFGQIVPHRGNVDDPSIHWRISKPEYALLDLAFLQGKTYNHAPQSLEWMVQNLMKKWEMEVSHKADIDQWTTVDPDTFIVRTLKVNMGPPVTASDLHTSGKYNGLLSHCPRHVYDAHGSSRGRSYSSFASAFPDGFAWEVLQVFSALPRVSFSWRHWGHCTASADKTSSDLVDLTGFAIVEIDPSTRINTMELFFKPEPFLDALRQKNFSDVSATTSTRSRRASAPPPALEDTMRRVPRRSMQLERPPLTMSDNSAAIVDELLRCPRHIADVVSTNAQPVHHNDFINTR